MMRDRVSARLVGEYAATLGAWLAPVPAGTAPLGLHWCLAPALAAQDRLGPDGHGPRVHAVDLAAYPRRMWVGGALELLARLPLEAEVTRVSTLLPLAYKTGAAGPLCLTGAAHVLSVAGDAVLRERQDIAFRGPAGAGQSAAVVEAMPPAGLEWTIATPTTLLLRYSALTFNAHRIHYDRDYARAVEGYADLVVHGPLQATVLLNLAATLLGQAPARFDYRATAPLLAGGGGVARGVRTPAGAELTMHDAAGGVTMRATASR
ncbi:MAG: protein dehydratase [Alphaproteobacteria bacterium]|nr:MAG: protein dehydratase [Alphaproteobacteria bacterium]